MAVLGDDGIFLVSLNVDSNFIKINRILFRLGHDNPVLIVLNMAEVIHDLVLE